MDASADVVRSPEGERTPKGVEPGSLLWARQHLEEVKAGLRDDPGRAYAVQFTAAAEMLREHDPVQFRSLRSLLLKLCNLRIRPILFKDGPVLVGPRTNIR